jgi:hypothetical protein
MVHGTMVNNFAGFVLRSARSSLVKRKIQILLVAVLSAGFVSVNTSIAQTPLIEHYANLTPKEYAYELAFSKYGWGKSEQKCLGMMWGKESAWDYTAISPTQDYGIPQRHMRNDTKEEIDAFMLNPQTQITWGLNYIEKRYSSPCGAWRFWQENRWY